MATSQRTIGRATGRSYLTFAPLGRPCDDGGSRRSTITRHKMTETNAIFANAFTSNEQISVSFQKPPDTRRRDRSHKDPLRPLGGRFGRADAQPYPHATHSLQSSILPASWADLATTPTRSHRTPMSDNEKSGDAPHYHGHRQRLRERFLEAGSEALSDYEMLELILFRAIPKRDVKPLAKELLKTFGSLAGNDLGARRAAQEDQRPGRCLRHRPQAGAGGGQSPAAGRGQAAAGAVIVGERARLLPRHHGLRGQGAIPRPVPRQAQPSSSPTRCSRPAPSTTPRVYPREVVKRALEFSATAVILLHNHPSGDPTPSRADIQMTQAIIEVAKPLGISVHDHIEFAARTGMRV